VTVDIPATDVTSRARVERVAPTRIGTATRKVGSSTTAVASSVASLTSRYAATPDALAEKPASVRECIAYTKAGGWMPGDRAPWLENIGKAYGYCIAIPATAALDVLEWFVQRPTRFLGAVLVLGLIRAVAHMVIG
jgi:hypothetical protein